jgi:hypothetical protein
MRAEQNLGWWSLGLLGLLFAPRGAAAPATPALQPLAAINVRQVRPAPLDELQRLVEKSALPEDVNTLTNAWPARARVVIATLPDPEQSALAVLADETLDAITSSAARAGFRMHVQHLPWKHGAPRQPAANDVEIELSTHDSSEQPPAEGPRPAAPAECNASPCPARHDLPMTAGSRTLQTSISSATDSSPHAAEPPQALRLQREDESHSGVSKLGLLTFRRDGAAGKFDLLIMLLVGESPVVGVDTDAMTEALSLTHELGCDDHLYVLGPHFTGSAPSLWNALADRRVTLATGSATGDLRSPDVQRDFVRTVVSDASMKKFLFEQLLSSRGSEPIKLALLRESATAFADDFASETMIQPSQGGPKNVRASQYLFPLHIAQLRSAHAGDDLPPPASHINLRHSLDVNPARHPTPNSEAFPTFSELTAPQVEASLRTVLKHIAREGTEYILIVATDPNDLMYVANEAKTYAPNAQLITIGGSALFSNPSVAHDLSGMLVASSYPPGVENQHWTEPRTEAIRSFPSDNAEGEYNALQWLIRDFAGDGSCAGFEPVDFKVPDSTRIGPRPWLSVIGAGHAWPLAVGEPECHFDLERSCESTRVAGAGAICEANGVQCTRPQSSTPRPFLRPTNYALGMSAFIAFAVFAHLLALYLARNWAPAATVPYVRVFARSDGALASAQRQYQGVALLALGFLGSYVTVCAWHTYTLSWIVPRFHSDTLKLLLPLALCTLLPIGVLGLLFHALRILGERDRAEPSSQPQPSPALTHPGYARIVEALIGVLVFALAVLAFVCGGGLWSALNLDPAARLLHLRLIDPFGLCPLSALAFLAAGVYAWAAIGMARGRAAADFPNIGPTSECKLHTAPRLSQCHDEADSTFGGRARSWELCCLTLLAAPALLIWARLLPSFAWAGFDWLFKALVIVLAGAAILACVHLRLLWDQLHRFLKQEAASLHIDAYSRIANKVSGSFGLQLRSNVPTANDLRRSVENFELLVTLAEQMPASRSMPERIQALRVELTLLRTAYRQKDEPSKYELRVRSAFFNASSKLSELLEQLYRHENEHAQLGQVQSRDTKDLLPGEPLGSVPGVLLLAGSTTPATQLWIRAAEDFVAMRVTSWLYHHIDQLRLLMGLALFSSLMVVCAEFSYPVQPQRFMMLVGSALVLLTVSTALRTMLQMQHNELLRRLRPATKIGALRLDLVPQIVTYVVLPTAVLAARLFPAMGDLLASRLEPLLTILQ